ncbi:GFA family protein [Bradyrhizobium guangxiense]|uniref:GFA family protein n=1 Tax=Bradyrhizobium guangxiense TaxID=1325115 RepID=UPI0010088E14|nr:GFA family protein [Bradyrhizobium guangxiense]
MIDARCSCGAVALSLPGPSQLVVVCHCLDCQRRTGAPFGVGAFYAAETVTISGMPKPYVRTAASGGKVRSYFCADCGSTLYWQADNLPAMIGVAVGAIAQPDFPAPIRSVFEQSKHHWVEIEGAEHLQRGSAPKQSR